MTGDYDYDIRELLKQILQTLKDMKKQEFDYWEAWKTAKLRECG